MFLVNNNNSVNYKTWAPSIGQIYSMFLKFPRHFTLNIIVNIHIYNNINKY